MIKGQHQISSFIEVTVSNILSFFIDLGFVLLIAPYFNIDITLPALTVGLLALYAIHILKSYVYRRFCNHLMLKRLQRNKQFEHATKQEMTEATEYSLTKYKNVIKKLAKR